MAIKQVKGGGGEITVEEFKELMKRFDRDGDGRISKEELRVFIRWVGGRFSGWKCGRGIRQADANGDGFIDESEIDNLVLFAQKSLGLKIVPY
ncbi:Calcium-binding protein CML24 [Acorus gramineus]|uniref:Calcium-binding protein CML24 n=1 Tax=Acorus gramineus TaxID=55184 RepID=A0AAV9A0K9_ACOGR|nr:Calcium-binding protein CML24 [Acorus gramineus]